MRWKSLPYDAARRFRALIQIAETFHLPESARILDVGGHPGTLGRLWKERHPATRFLTVDTVDADLPDYQCTSGEDLPFSAKEFDLVLSSDTLEHVRPGDRPAFVRELERVSSGPVLLGAPFSHSAVQQAERTLSETWKSLTGKPHPWLDEHLQHGLPGLRATLDLFSPDRVQSLFQNAPLQEWLVWQWGSLWREIRGDLDEAWEEFDHLLTELVGEPLELRAGELRPFTAESEAGFLPYRWIIASQPPDRVIYTGLKTTPQDTFSADSRLCDATGNWFQAMTLSLAGEGKAESTEVSEAINGQLVQALRHAEEQVSELERQLTHERRRHSLAWLLRRILGRS